MVKYKRFGLETEYDQIIIEVFTKQENKFNDCNFKYLEKLYNEFTSKSSTIGVNEITETPYVHSIFFIFTT